MHDGLLGYAPKPRLRGAGASSWSMTIDADGFGRSGSAARRGPARSSEKPGLATIDTYPRPAAEPAAKLFYVNSHMRPRGNAMGASLLAARLRELSRASDRRTSTIGRISRPVPVS
ncbi:MAG: hypothetical protein Q8M69_19085, partial [Reyranella sp.]|nr:hypothetical protein [Reyranella sp.]